MTHGAGLRSRLDLFIADHGSVAFYAAAMGKPLLLASFGHDKLVPSSAMAEIGRLATPLHINEVLRPQIDLAIQSHDPDRFSSARERISGAPGQSLAILRRTIYSLLRLDEPDDPPRVLTVGRPALTCV